MTVRVLLVDDQVLIRSGFTALIGSAEDLRVFGATGDDAEAVRRATELCPDVVLMDVGMPGMDGLAAARRSPPPRISPTSGSSC